MEALLIILIFLAGIALAWAGRARVQSFKPQSEVPSPSLESLSSEEIDASLADEKHTFRRPHALQTITYVVASAIILTSFLISFVSGGWSLLSLLLAVAELLLLFTHGTPLLISITRTLTVSPEGIEARDLFGRRSIEWWEVQHFLVAEDLSRFRAEGIRGLLTYDTAGFAPGPRLALYRAVRANLERSQRALEPWTQAGALVRFVKANALSLGVFAAAMIVTAFAGDRLLPQSNALGLRCAYASGYLREKYGLPDRHGCVVLRVNPGTGADRAGVAEGDMIVALEGVPVTSGPQFNTYWESLDKHKQEFTVVRPHETVEHVVEVTLGSPGATSFERPAANFLFQLTITGGR